MAPFLVLFHSIMTYLSLFLWQRTKVTNSISSLFDCVLLDFFFFALALFVFLFLYRCYSRKMPFLLRMIVFFMLYVLYFLVLGLFRHYLNVGFFTFVGGACMMMNPGGGDSSASASGTIEALCRFPSTSEALEEAASLRFQEPWSAGLPNADYPVQPRQPEPAEVPAPGQYMPPGSGDLDSSARRWVAFEEGVLLEDTGSAEPGSSSGEPSVNRRESGNAPAESGGSNSLNSAMPRASTHEAGPSRSHEWMLAHERFCALLEHHLHRYRELPQVMGKYPKLLEADLRDLAEKMALDFLDVDIKSASEIDALAASEPLRTYTKAKSSLESFLGAHYSD